MRIFSVLYDLFAKARSARGARERVATSPAADLARQQTFEQADKLARQEIALASLRQAMAVEEALTKARDDPLKEIEAQATLDRIKLKLKSDEAQQRDELMAALGAMSEVETQFQGRTIGRGDGDRATGKGDDEGMT